MHPINIFTDIDGIVVGDVIKDHPATSASEAFKNIDESTQGSTIDEKFDDWTKASLKRRDTL